jgi:hypothetical protein
MPCTCMITKWTVYYKYQVYTQDMIKFPSLKIVHYSQLATRVHFVRAVKVMAW